MGRKARLAGVATGCALVAAAALGAPAIAQTQQDGTVALAGSVPAWATPSAKIGGVPANQQRHVQIALALPHQDAAANFAQQVSTPGSANYQHFLTSQQFVDRYGPTQETVDSVRSWLTSQGLHVDSVSGNRHFVNVTGSTATLEKAFGTTLATYRYRAPGGVVQRLVAPTHAISLPSKLTGITAVLGLDDGEKTLRPQHIVAPAVQPAAAQDGQGCAQYWDQVNNASVPQKYAEGAQSNVLCGYGYAQTRAIYGLGAQNTGRGATIGITDAFDNATTAVDANTAAAAHGAPPLTPMQYRAVDPPGGFNADPSCDPAGWAGEQALDVQAAHTISPSGNLVYYGARDCNSLDDALNTAVSDNQVSIVSNSWGSTDGEQGLSDQEKAQFDSIAVESASQGQTLLFSSGDTGDLSSMTGHPVAPWPASNPWVTAVGGTTVGLDQNNKTVVNTGWENAAEQQQGDQWVPVQGQGAVQGAGGGLSQVYDQPDYQRQVAQTHGKRGVVDIAALANPATGFDVLWTDPSAGPQHSPVGGTSLASPLIAGLVADAAQTQGQDRFGAVNAALYDLAGSSAMQDVASHPVGIWSPALPGQPQGSYLTDVDTRPQSLQSATGWDPVTGVGTPTAQFLTQLGK